MQAKVGISGDRGVEVDEGLSIAVRGSCGLSEVVELGVRFEGFNGVRGDFGSVA